MKVRNDGEGPKIAAINAQTAERCNTSLVDVFRHLQTLITNHQQNAQLRNAELEVPGAKFPRSAQAGYSGVLRGIEFSLGG